MAFRGADGQFYFQREPDRCEEKRNVYEGHTLVILALVILACMRDAVRYRTLRKACLWRS